MDANTMDRLARYLAIAGTRRGLMRLLVVLPTVGLVDALLVDGSEATRRHRRHHKRKPHHSARRERVEAERKKRKKKKKQGSSPLPPPPGTECTPQSNAQTCAGQCGVVSNNCGQTVDCGSCACHPPCPACQACNEGTGVCGPDSNQVGDACGTSCHACDASGQCQPVANDTACDDGDLCTRTDTCQEGLCVGGNPVVCTALDQCHVAGVCDPATGTCSNPNKTNGTTCDDGNACTQTDSCQSGVCTGGNPVLCPANQCQNPGTCNPANGTCSAATNKPHGTTCSGGVCCSGTCATGSCCTNAQCANPQPICVSHTCTPCSDISQCTANQLCDSGSCRNCDVCTTPSCNFTSVQAAVAATSPQLTTIRICPGTYSGPDARATISRNLTVIGAGEGNNPAVDTILDAAGVGRPLAVNGGTSVALRNLRLTGGNNGGVGGGIVITNTATTLTACSVIGNTAPTGGGIYVNTGSTVTLNSCAVTGNSATLTGGGIANLGAVNLHASNVSGNTLNGAASNCSGPGTYNDPDHSCAG